MKCGWKTWLCSLEVSGLAAVARSDIAAPPNDYTGFLYKGGHYLKAGGCFSADTLWMSFVCICLALPVGMALFKNRFFRRGILSWKAIVLAVLFEAAMSVVILVFGDSIRASLGLMPAGDGIVYGHHWPALRYRDTPRLRAQYDRFCIDWYNAHRGAYLDRYEYMFWRKVPEMREGAPEAVTNAYEAFLKSLRSEREMMEELNHIGNHSESYQ